jgi:GAF domain-containing protein
LNEVTFEKLLADLLLATSASRVTLRLARPGEVFPVIAEVLAPGTPSIASGPAPDLTNAPTMRYLAERRANLIQDDCSTAEVPPPPELLEFYGVKAQMLAPIVGGTELIGLVSVHYTPSPRHWTTKEIDALDRTAREIQRALDEGG